METTLWADLSDAEAEQVVGGVGVEVDHTNFGAGSYGWIGGANHLAPEDHKGLIQAGFLPGSTIEAGPNTVFVPGSK